LSFQANYCDQKKRKTCKTKQEIKEFLYDKFFILFYNKEEFLIDGFGEKKFRTVTKSEWLSIDVNRQL